MLESFSSSAKNGVHKEFAEESKLDYSKSRSSKKGTAKAKSESTAKYVKTPDPKPVPRTEDNSAFQLNEKQATHTTIDQPLSNTAVANANATATGANNTTSNTNTNLHVNLFSTNKQHTKNGTSHSAIRDSKSIFMRTAEFLIKYNAFNVCHIKITGKKIKKCIILNYI